MKKKKITFDFVPPDYTPECQAVLDAALGIVRAGPKVARNEWIKRVYAKGYAATEIAKVTGLTRPHIYTILKS